MRALLLVAALAMATPAPAAERASLVIETAAARHAFAVELVRTPEEMARGLMFRRELAADAGMLFLYPEDRPASMWMKNTLLSLDMLFIDAGGRIVHIVARTVPGSLESISAGRDVRAVLELNAGTADRLGIVAGDRVLHPELESAAAP